VRQHWQLLFVAFEALQTHLSMGCVKFLVTLVSFLVQLQFHDEFLVVAFVTLVQEQFWVIEVPSHLNVLLVGGVLLTCDDHCP
jgi:hypothetical protein